MSEHFKYDVYKELNQRKSDIFHRIGLAMLARETKHGVTILECMADPQNTLADKLGQVFWAEIFDTIDELLTMAPEAV